METTTKVAETTAAIRGAIETLEDALAMSALVPGWPLLTTTLDPRTGTVTATVRAWDNTTTLTVALIPEDQRTA